MFFQVIVLDSVSNMPDVGAKKRDEHVMARLIELVTACQAAIPTYSAWLADIQSAQELTNESFDILRSNVSALEM